MQYFFAASSLETFLRTRPGSSQEKIRSIFPVWTQGYIFQRATAVKKCVSGELTVTGEGLFRVGNRVCVRPTLVTPDRSAGAT